MRLAKPVARPRQRRPRQRWRCRQSPHGGPAEVGELLAQNKLVLKIQTFPFDRAAEAYRISKAATSAENSSSSPEAPPA
jgi:hypothetical protein